MNTPVITLTTSPTPEEDKAVVDALIAYNTASTGEKYGNELAILVRDPDSGAVTGGLRGRISHDWLFVEWLVVPEKYRGQGLGSELMRKAEAHARACGCAGLWLDTFSFQAKPFYEKLGFTCFGELTDHPRGGARYFMKKGFWPQS